MRAEDMQPNGLIYNYNGLIYNFAQKNLRQRLRKAEIRMDIFRKEYGQTLSFVRTKTKVLKYKTFEIDYEKVGALHIKKEDAPF